MPDSLLRIEGLSKSFRGVKALSDVQLTVRSGEIHALMGENGAGKSTLIKALTGVHVPDSGRIHLNGREISPTSPRDAENLGISTVYQEVNLIPSLSVADNICLGRQPTNFGFLDKSAMRRRASEALKRIGMTLDVNRSLASCSMAEQQLVAIARALDVDAKLLILDEPTSSLDEREVAFLFDVMRKLRSEGLGILFVTHFLDQVYAVSDRITVLRNGTFVGEYVASELPRLKLINAMLGREFAEMEKLEAATASSETQSETLLEAKGISKRGIMSSIDLDIRKGEVLGLAGLLGSGRTETAKMLFGIHPTDTGTISIHGVGAKVRSPREAMRHGFGFCSEDRKTEGAIPHLSVRENIILALQSTRGALRLLSRTEQQTLADHYIRALNIKTASAETPIMNLSGGNQQKALLARWLATQPKLIILDEPTRGIDVGAKAEIEKLIHSLRGQGMSVLFISSDVEEIVRTCQRVAVLRDRKKIRELSGSEIQPENIVHVIAHHE
jgi:monosaccharide-transporting ATPase